MPAAAGRSGPSALPLRRITGTFPTNEKMDGPRDEYRRVRAAEAVCRRFMKRAEGRGSIKALAQFGPASQECANPSTGRQGANSMARGRAFLSWRQM